MFLCQILDPVNLFSVLFCVCVSDGCVWCHRVTVSLCHCVTCRWSTSGHPQFPRPRPAVQCHPAGVLPGLSGRAAHAPPETSHSAPGPQGGWQGQGSTSLSIRSVLLPVIVIVVYIDFNGDLYAENHLKGGCLFLGLY